MIKQEYYSLKNRALGEKWINFLKWQQYYTSTEWKFSSENEFRILSFESAWGKRIILNEVLLLYRYLTLFSFGSLSSMIKLKI